MQRIKNHNNPGFAGEDDDVARHKNVHESDARLGLINCHEMRWEKVCFVGFASFKYDCKCFGFGGFSRRNVRFEEHRAIL